MFRRRGGQSSLTCASRADAVRDCLWPKQSSSTSAAGGWPCAPDRRGPCHTEAPTHASHGGGGVRPGGALAASEDHSPHTYTHHTLAHTPHT